MTFKRIPKVECAHLGGAAITTTTKKQCEACDFQTHLRLCAVCGYVGCCESENAHNTEHYEQTGHAIIKPTGTDYDWLWCYACQAFLE